MTDKLITELRALLATFTGWATLHPNEQPQFPTGIRPFSTGDLRHNIDVLTRAADALEPSGDVVERVARAILKAHALDTAGLGQNTVDAIADHAWQSWIPEAIAAIGASHAE